MNNVMELDASACETCIYWNWCCEIENPEMKKVRTQAFACKNLFPFLVLVSIIFWKMPTIAIRVMDKPTSGH